MENQFVNGLENDQNLDNCRQAIYNNIDCKSYNQTSSSTKTLFWRKKHDHLLETGDHDESEEFCSFPIVDETKGETNPTWQKRDENDDDDYDGDDDDDN